MRRRFSLLAVGCFAVASLLLIHAALAVEITPPGGGFSVTFPIEPKPRPDPAPRPELRTMLWVASNDSYVYAAGYSDYAQRHDSKGELEASLKNFLAAVKGHALSQKVGTVSRPGGPPLPAMQFSYAGDELSGVALFIIEDKRVYTAAGSIINDKDGDPAEIARFMKSFRLTAKR
jgi:hypothetical protein